jgi:hypothetical protein
MTQEALKLALEALQSADKLINGSGTSGGLLYCMDAYYSDCFDADPIVKQIDEAVAAIKEALAQPEQKPVAKYSDIVSDGGLDPRNTIPPQRTFVGLTDEEVFEICNSNYSRDSDLVQMIEAKLKQKNG